MKRGTPDHPKTHTLMAVLNIEKWGAVGILEGLWHFAQRYAPAGDIGRHSDEDIARFIGWTGNAATLVSGLAKAGWIDRCSCHRARVHDWPDHADVNTKRAANFKFLGCYGTPGLPVADAVVGPRPVAKVVEGPPSVHTECIGGSTVVPAVPCLAVPSRAAVSADPPPDFAVKDAILRAGWEKQRELLRTVGAIGNLTGRDPPEIMRQVTAYKRRDGTVVPGRVNPGDLSAERVEKSLEDAKAWLASEEKKREAGRAGTAGHGAKGLPGAQ